LAALAILSGRRWYVRLITPSRTVKVTFVLTVEEDQHQVVVDGLHFQLELLDPPQGDFGGDVPIRHLRGNPKPPGQISFSKFYHLLRLFRLNRDGYKGSRFKGV
jgi:hypothetical protein